VPQADAFQGEGTHEAREFLLALLASDHASPLLERARRELGRMVGFDLGSLPRDPAGRAVWVETLAERVLGTSGESPWDGPEATAPRATETQVPADGR
jgi:hypothetical protein